MELLKKLQLKLPNNLLDNQEALEQRLLDYVELAKIELPPTASESLVMAFVLYEIYSYAILEYTSAAETVISEGDGTVKLASLNDRVDAIRPYQRAAKEALDKGLNSLLADERPTRFFEVRRGW